MVLTHIANIKGYLKEREKEYFHTENDNTYS